MKPARIENHTNELPAPPDWDRERNGPCGTLFIRNEVLNGVNFMQSAWDVEVLEALKIAAGSRVVLGIAGFQHPVVHMSHTEPPEDFEPVIMCRRAFDDSRQAVARIDAIYPHPGPQAIGFLVWSTCPIGNQTFEAAAVVAMAKARELAEEIQTGKKELP